jgi:hypothetical protein
MHGFFIARPTPFSLLPRYKVAVYAPAEMADTLPVFHLYPICTHGFRPSWDGDFRCITSQAFPMQPGRRCGPGYPQCLAGQTYCPSGNLCSAPSMPLAASRPCSHRAAVPLGESSAPLVALLDNPAAPSLRGKVRPTASCPLPAPIFRWQEC